MVLMAGMLPGVECARRRRLRQGGGSAAGEAPCGTRRPSLCLYAGGHDHALLGSSKQRSGGCEEAAARVRHGWTLDSNAREAKERLDQKLRSQRESAALVVKRHNSAGKLPQAGTSGGGGGDGDQSASSASAAQREVYSSKTGGRSGWRPRGWFRLGRRPAAASEEEEEEEECAVCLEELRAGEAVAHLPCAHRFHWGCAVPWVQAASRCPVCRAAVHLAVAGSNQ